MNFQNMWFLAGYFLIPQLFAIMCILLTDYNRYKAR